MLRMASPYHRTPVVLTVACTDTYVSRSTKFESGDTSGTTAVASGGIGSYTYAWTHETELNLLTINSPSTAATSFHWEGLEALDETQSDFRVTATDSVGNTGYQIITVYVARSDFE